MTIWKRFGFLQYGILVTVIFSSVFAYNLFKGDQQFYLPGETTHGHHQIEMQCTACHVESFDSGDLMQGACVSCHGEALKKARDTHPKSKFTDPRNAELLSNLDATKCVTCHVEHSPEITGEFGVTMPEDFCFFCHQSVGEERPSHANLPYDSCSNSGCHNYHDNKALYEKFLAKHLDEPAILGDPQLRVANSMSLWAKKNKGKRALLLSQHDGEQIDGATGKIVAQWAESAHAIAQVNCSDCHVASPTGVAGGEMGLTSPQDAEQTHPTYSGMDIRSCESCHQRQSMGFSEGLHGMRPLATGLKMQVSKARLPMHEKALDKTVSCVSCHSPHQPDLNLASVESCLSCHNDDHSNNFKSSPHFGLWTKEMSGEAEAGTGVSCATCHLPREKKGTLVFVNHNQNHTLEPNSKMIRPVCGECHGLEFTISALSDESLIKRNFSSTPTMQHQSFDFVRARLANKKAKRASKKK